MVLSSPVSPSAVAWPPKAASTGAERRQLTVMFVDLAGSTAMSARLDPEDMREVIGAYQRCVAQEVARFDGHVAKYMGDGVLVYFGYPRAHEDDAERAVRAGLGIAAVVGQLTSHPGLRLQVRVGIATGLVVVGDLIGQGSSQEQAVVGDTPNLAARLQALAEPNAVVIALATRRLIGDLFELVDQGRHEIKGFAESVQVWRVLGEGATESRLRGAARGRNFDAAGRTTARDQAALGPVGVGQDGCWAGCSALGRPWHRKVAPDTNVARAAGHRNLQSP